jgi:two-component system CheB/CheR fusion protein
VGEIGLREDTVTPNLPIVGIGASAGGVEALETFFKAVPADNGMAFVVVTHLPPNHHSLLAEILGRATWMPVVNASEDETVEAQHVYVLPPAAILTIREGRLRLRRTGAADRERLPIDVFFNSLAEDQAEHAIGIVLSGGGSDGTLGLKAIKEHGGLTIAQGANVTRPRFNEMPSSAVAAGFVDLLLPVEDIPQRILTYVRNWIAFDPVRPVNALSKVHALLRTRTGHDFGDYKERTFQRRVQRRMQVVQTTKLEDYVEQLEKRADEVTALFRDLLIGVTEFFRNAPAFRALETVVMPKLFEGRGADDELRVWVPGCATGEEVYSIAILLREHIDTLEAPPKVQIFATDIDEAAMGLARAARYPAALVKEVSPERLKRFFVHEGATYRLVKDLRDMCIFSTHSVIRDPPFSRLDLISCRNLLIYLKPELQAQVIPLFHYALEPGGYLFLGHSENISRSTELFLPLDKKNRIFRRRDLVARLPLPLRQFLPQRQRKGDASNGGGQLQRSDLLRTAADTIAKHFAPTYVIVDEANEVQYFSAGTGKYLQAPPGPPSRNILAMARPGLRSDLRAALHRAKESGRQVARNCVAVQINGDVQTVSLIIEPITEGNEIAYAVVFVDRDLIRSRDESGDAERPAGEDATVREIEQELQETKDHCNPLKVIAELTELREKARRVRDVAQGLIDDYHLLLAWRRAIVCSTDVRRRISG